MRDVDGCSRLGVANFGHRWHHDFGSRRTDAVPLNHPANASILVKPISVMEAEKLAFAY